MKVVVSRDLCVGHGLCEAVSDELFAVGDDGVTRVLLAELSDAQGELAAQAVAACPSRALRLEQ
ncbi:ferredoxin [Nocardia otitidiscaviarum]|uniref:ferredoxin n=1 Tax=Nocardia otitidiscaviarum TaxID=1823 RepID=UPI001FD03CE7|nr:ferredoxin [Nocardia otitidiscaviarum]MCP9624949.1 ferredoxin [Nocardia otitidiscaviarum]